MKTIKKLLLTLLVVIPTLVSLSSCQGGSGSDPFSKYQEGFTDTGSVLYYKTTHNFEEGLTVQLFTINYNSDKVCTTAQWEISFPTKSIAEEGYNEIIEVFKAQYQSYDIAIDGKMVTVYLTMYFKDWDIETLKEVIKSMEIPD